MNMGDSYHRIVILSKLTGNIAATFDKDHGELVGASSQRIWVRPINILSKMRW